jgi:glutathione S-transferase
VTGLCFAFPLAKARLKPNYSRVIATHDRVAARPRIAAYVARNRRLAFNEHGIFRHYPELDDAG